ncbi:MAG: adenosylcobinamide-GDP ribazoletransferase [Methanospirillum sp.]|uniref:adenosylcobinamide-GDP ribazoletransferase n=1 Tax=Methanospirillum sp. TaxID=45200 RepID=UPI002372F7EF|nr:adenosylcobinamide-GDP ribazoletransferase [Methanospirillum sp.]MDD1728348.1 adenosylcobinamide-GDP ribazoletransferase [Methanospirillum sp.]
MKTVQSVIALLQFTTILPLGKTAPFEAFSQTIWLYPLAGYVTGGIAAIMLYLISAPAFVSATIGLGIVFLITGCNHLDGLLDLGDGLMAHGTREIRVRALTDRTVGTGGIALGLMITLLAWSSLASVPLTCVAILLAEVSGKYAMAVMTIFGRPFHPGLHAMLHEHASRWFILPSTLLLLPLLYLPLPKVVLGASMIVTILVPVVLIGLASRLFGGVNGDVTGASGEITRAFVLMVIACTAGITG